jgi:membrane associated rhomboid family serine protease
MFVPIHDTNPLKRIPYQYVTVGLITLNCVIYVLFQSGLIFSLDERIVAFALIPAEFWTDGVPLASRVVVPPGAPPVEERWTLVTYMFVHGSLLHLLGNMLFLWVFGDNVEDAMGHFRFFLFFIMCGVFAGLAHTVVMQHSEVPVIGSSGSVAGIVAAYLMLHPKVKIWVLALWRIPIKISAAWVLGFWVLLQVGSALIDNSDGIAWWAHVGGLVAGAMLILFMRRQGVPLFDKTAGGA